MASKATNTLSSFQSSSKQEDEVSALIRLQAWHKGLTLELEILYQLLSKSFAQHGHTKYHRRTKQIHKLLTNRHCVLNIAPVAKNVSGRFESLVKDARKRIKRQKKVSESKSSTKLPDIDEDSLHPSRRSSVSSALTTTSNKSEADLIECVPPNYASQSLRNASAVHYSRRLSFPSPPTTCSSLCEGLEWLYQIHKQRILHWEGSMASRIHDLTHLYCMELARGYFIPQLIVMLAAMARIKYILHNMGKCIVLFLLELKEAKHLLPIFDYLSDSMTEDKQQTLNESNDGHSWLVEGDKYIACPTANAFEMLKLQFSNVFDDVTFAKDLRPYQPSVQTEKKGVSGSALEASKSVTPRETEFVASANKEGRSKKDYDDNKITFVGDNISKNLCAPDRDTVASTANDSRKEDLGESVFGEEKDDHSNNHGQKHIPKDKNEALLATFSAMQAKDQRKKKKRERDVKVNESIDKEHTKDKLRRGDPKEKKRKRKKQEQNTAAPKTALDEIFDSTADAATSNKARPSREKRDKKRKEKEKKEKKSKKKQKSQSVSRHVLDEIFDSL